MANKQSSLQFLLQMQRSTEAQCKTAIPMNNAMAWSAMLQHDTMTPMMQNAALNDAQQCTMMWHNAQ